MAQNNYQVIVTDINHYNSPVSGDAFILQNKERLKDPHLSSSAVTNGQYRALARIAGDECSDPCQRCRRFQHLTALIQQRLEESKSTEAITESEIRPINAEVTFRPASKSSHVINESAGWIGQMLLVSDGKRIAAQTSSKGVLLWDRETENAVIIDSNTNPTGGVTWSPDGKTLAYTSKTNVLLFDTVQMQGKGLLMTRLRLIS